MEKLYSSLQAGPLRAPFQFILQRKEWFLIFGFLLILGIVALFYLVEVDDLQWLVAASLSFVQDRPLLLLGSICILPGLGFPLTPLVLLSGAVFSPHFGIPGAIAVTMAAVAVCMTWSYWMAAYPFRDTVDRLLLRREVELPDVSKSGYIMTTFLIRAAPGPPFVLQNYSLGFLRVPFGWYLLISVPVNLFYTAGFIIAGRAIIDGNVRLLLLSILLLAGIIWGVRLSLARRKANGNHE